MRIYGNDLPGHRDVSIDGGHLLKVADRMVNRKHSRLVLDVSDGRLEWRARRSRRQFIESKFLFALRRGAGGLLYVGLNRVIAGDFRSGSGLCRALVSLFADRGQSLSVCLFVCLSVCLSLSLSLSLSVSLLSACVCQRLIVTHQRINDASVGQESR